MTLAIMHFQECMGMVRSQKSTRGEGGVAVENAPYKSGVGLVEYWDEQENPGRTTMVPQVMTPVPMIEPSSWLRSGITVEKVDGVTLAKFTPELHDRLEELLEKRKGEQLTSLEEAEYTGISELERILTFVNAKLIAYHDN